MLKNHYYAPGPGTGFVSPRGGLLDLENLDD